MSLTFVYIKNSLFGNGHHTRILNLRKKLKKKNKIRTLNIALENHKKKLLRSIKKEEKIFIDISNNFFLKLNKKFLKNLFIQCKAHNVNLSLIDSKSPNSILDYYKTAKIQNYINPDVDKIKKNKNLKNVFLGPKYLIGLNEFRYYSNKSSKNILIFLTASKSNLNIKLAKLIKKEKIFFSNYKINFISNDYKILKKKFSDLKFVKFIKVINKDKLKEYLKKTNLVISGQGNFKYEILLARIPLIIIVNNNLYNSFKKRFLNTPLIKINMLSTLKKIVFKTSFNKTKIYFKKLRSSKNIFG
jgi:hypothetical protein